MLVPVVHQQFWLGRQSWQVGPQGCSVQMGYVLWPALIKWSKNSPAWAARFLFTTTWARLPVTRPGHCYCLLDGSSHGFWGCFPSKLHCFRIQWFIFVIRNPSNTDQIALQHFHEEIFHQHLVFSLYGIHPFILTAPCLLSHHPSKGLTESVCTEMEEGAKKSAICSLLT